MQIEKKEDIKILSKYFLKKGTKYKVLRTIIFFSSSHFTFKLKIVIIYFSKNYT